MSGFDRIHRKNGFYFADDTRLDRKENIKVFGENGTLMGLEFIVPGEEARISDSWRKIES